MNVGRLLSAAMGLLLCGAAIPATAADYQREVWSPLHLAPNTAKATNAECLACHSEILQDKIREVSPAGKKTSDIGPTWYQTLDTYKGTQETFHARHLTTAYAKKVMDLKCSTCHTGHDPREESMARPRVEKQDGKWTAIPVETTFRLRKQVNPETTCLMCHGKFPFENMSLPDEWSKIRTDMENEDAKNGCLTCHAEQTRTNRHQVTYLKAANIEKLAKDDSDVCYGCHGGRAWYRLSFPYPRHDWPDMPADVPDWATDRPKQSEARFRLDAGTAKH